MKIFGKKRTKLEDSTDPEEITKESSNTDLIPSYFASQPKKTTLTTSTRHNPTVEELLSKDPQSLTSKERRLIRRFQERQKETSSSHDEAPQKPATEHSDSVELLHSSEILELNVEQRLESTVASCDIVQQLQGINSKERRQLLRAWKKTQTGDSIVVEQVLSIATEEAKRVGHENLKKDQRKANTQSKNENELQVVETSEDQDSKKRKKERKRELEDDKVDIVMSTENNKEKSVKTPKTSINGKPNKDWSHLSSEERQRREHQRQKQREAEERRKAPMESGTGMTSHRHPLNSERRRANRRKPSGKAGRLLLKRKRGC